MNFETGQKLQINYMSTVFKSIDRFDFTIICYRYQLGIHC